MIISGFSSGTHGKEPACQRRRGKREEGWIPGLGRSLEDGVAAEIPLDRGAWRATVHGVEESDMSEATEHACNIIRQKDFKKCIETDVHGHGESRQRK